jgi:hypothetical protein
MLKSSHKAFKDSPLLQKTKSKNPKQIPQNFQKNEENIKKDEIKIELELKNEYNNINDNKNDNNKNNNYNDNNNDDNKIENEEIANKKNGERTSIIDNDEKFLFDLINQLNHNSDLNLLISKINKIAEKDNHEIIDKQNLKINLKGDDLDKFDEYDKMLGTFGVEVTFKMLSYDVKTQTLI